MMFFLHECEQIRNNKISNLETSKFGDCQYFYHVNESKRNGGYEIRAHFGGNYHYYNEVYIFHLMSY